MLRNEAFSFSICWTILREKVAIMVKSRNGNYAFLSAIDFTSVSNAIHAYHANRVGNFVNDAVIPNANSPVIVRSGKFSATGWARIFRETLNR